MESKEVDKKKSKFGIVILIIFLVVLLFGGGYFIYKQIYIEDSSNNESNKNDNNNSNNSSEVIDTSNYKYSMKAYKTDTNDLCFEYDETYCKNLVFTLKMETDNYKVLSKNKKYILYDDNGLKLYNSNNNEIIKIDLENTYDTYSISYYDYVESYSKVTGIVYKNNNENASYYDLITKSKKFENKYQNLYILDENYLSGSNYTEETSTAYLLNIKDEKEELVYSDININSELGSVSFSENKYNDKYFYKVNKCAEYCIPQVIYDNNKKEIFRIPSTVEMDYYSSFDHSFYEDKLYLVENKIVKKYDIEGNLISTSRQYEDFKQLITNNIIYVKNNNLVIENLDTNEIKEIVKWDNAYFYDEDTSSYYSRNALDNMNESDKEAGIYLVIYYRDMDKNGNYGMEYCYKSTGEIITYPIKEAMGGRAKPVLYLYPTTTTNIKVTFEHPEYLTTTYPKYYNSWEVKANPNGDLYDKNNKYYYALYWDEIRYHEVNFNEGFYVTKDNAINFLEEKLTIIGLNDREKNEFIMYWLPILENNKQSLVYFELTEERESTNKLIIEPKPDSLLRVSIHIKKVNEKISIKEQKLNTFERNGFVAVEWGGMTY